MNTVNVAMPLWLWALLLLVIGTIIVLAWAAGAVWMQDTLADVDTEYDVDDEPIPYRLAPSWTDDQYERDRLHHLFLRDQGVSK